MAYPERQTQGARFRGLGLLFVALLPGCTASALAQTYRWVDERGRVHYGDTLPPRAIDPAVLDKQGRMLRQLPRSQTGASSGAVAAHANETARERQDLALLSTYANEGEIDLARDRALAHEQAKRDSLQAMLMQAEARLSELQAETTVHAQARRPLPETLRQSIAYEQGEIARLNQALARNAAAMNEIETRYAAYKARYRFLKAQGVAPTSPPDPPPAKR